MLKHLVLVATLLFTPFTLHAAGMVDINTATAEAIADGVNGLGASKAEAIVKYREKHGPFKTVDDVGKVSGIGEATLKKIRPQVTVSAIEKTKK